MSSSSSHDCRLPGERLGWGTEIQSSLRTMPSRTWCKPIVPSFLCRVVSWYKPISRFPCTLSSTDTRHLYVSRNPTRANSKWTTRTKTVNTTTRNIPSIMILGGLGTTDTTHITSLRFKVTIASTILCRYQWNPSTGPACIHHTKCTRQRGLHIHSCNL